MKHRICHSPLRAPLLLDPLGTLIETPVDPRRGFKNLESIRVNNCRGTRRPWIFLSLSPQVAFHQCPMGTAECTARGAGNPRRGFKKPRIHPREQYQEVPVDHRPDPKPRIGANYSFAYKVDGWPSCSSRLKMHHQQCSESTEECTARGAGRSTKDPRCSCPSRLKMHHQQCSESTEECTARGAGNLPDPKPRIGESPVDPWRRLKNLESAHVNNRQRCP